MRSIILALFLLPLMAFAKQPNIIFILSDDAGFEEFGLYKVKKNTPSNTPNIDALAEQGVAFKHAWTQAICGPSRSMVLSGNYAINNGAYDNKIFYLPDGQNNSDKDRLPSFTRVLKDAGYSVKVSGKWHNPAGGHIIRDQALLGVDSYTVWSAEPEDFEKILKRKLVPDDTWEESAKSGEPKISRYWKPGIIENGKVLNTTMNDYGPDIFSNAIMDFMTEQTKANKPFLAYYTMVLPHSAHGPTPDDVKRGDKPTNKNFPKGQPKGRQYFLSQVNYADKLVGKIVDKVKQLKIEDNTIIVFASDNGTTASAKSKGVEYGVHVPFIVAGAGIKTRGLTDELMDFTDVLPTFAALANTEIDKKYSYDGTNIAPYLTGKSDETKPVIYSFPGVSTLIRTKDYLLEAVTPIYGYDEGRLYKTNGSHDGRGYENITHDENYKEVKAYFAKLLADKQSPLPDSFDDPAWQKTAKMKKGLKEWNTKRKRIKHVELPKEYQFYDPSF